MTSNTERIIEENRRLEHENRAMSTRLETLERDKAMADLQRRTLLDEKAALKEQLDTAVGVERKKGDESRAEWTVVVQQHSNDIRRLRQENDNLRRQNEMLQEESTKRASGSEVSQVRMSSQLSQIQKELAAKDAELAATVKESQFMRDNLERVVKELVDRNKRTDEESKKRAATHEKETQDLLAEHHRRVAEVGELRKEAQHAREERALLEAQVAHGKQLNKDLTADIDGLRAKVAAAEAAFEEVQHEARELRRHEEDMRRDIDELLGKLAKADSHIQRLTEEASQANLTALKLRHQLELTEDEAIGLRRDKEEVTRRLGPLLRAAGDQVDALARGIEAVVSGAGELATGQPTSSSRAVSFKCWPEVDGTAPQDERPSHESQLLMCALRLRDVTALMGEDLSLVQRAVADAHVRLREAERRESTTDDGIKAERAHVLEMAARLGDTEAELQRSEDARRALEQTLVESSQWMSEAASLGEERSKRVELLVTERSVLEEKVQALSVALDDARADVRKAQQDVAVLQGELTKANVQLETVARVRTTHESELTAAKAAVTQLRQRVAELEAAEQRAKADGVAKRSLDDRFDQDARVAKRLAEDANARASVKDRELEEADRREQKLRDQLFETQKKLDAALRRPTATASLSTSDVPVPFNPVPAPRSPAASTARLGSPLRSAATFVPASMTTTSGASSLRQSAVASNAAQTFASPARAPPSAATISESSTVSPPRGRPSVFGLPAAEAANSERLRAWEARINSMLSQVRGGPTA